MENEELVELKRKFYREIDELKREFKSFKSRISVIANLLIPGIGFFIYGSSYFKGLITFILFVTYNMLFFNKVLPMVDMTIAVIYYLPAVVIWVGSAVMVSNLND